MTQIRHSSPVDTMLLQTNPKYKFNPYIDALAPAASIQLAEKAKTLAAAGQTIFDLTIGEPDFDTPASIKEAAIRAIARNNTHYVNGRGILPLRERIATKLREENGIACANENILVTPGAKSAIYVAVRKLIGAGDEAIVLDPSCVSYASIIQASGGIVHSVELPYDDGHRITLTKLEATRSDRCRLLIVNSPNNPTGRMLDSGEAQAIADFASRHNVYVVADEIYEKIAFDWASAYQSWGYPPDCRPPHYRQRSLQVRSNDGLAGWVPLCQCGDGRQDVHALPAYVDLYQRVRAGSGSCRLRLSRRN